MNDFKHLKSYQSTFPGTSFIRV